MNRIEEKLSLLTEKKEKAFVTYMTAGLPDIKGTKDLIFAQQEAGADIIELGIPFSDPVADGPILQNASYQAICRGVNLEKIFQLMEEVRREGASVPIVFMMYYNTILHYGIHSFAEKCRECGVDGVLSPDLPLEEQAPLRNALEECGSTILIPQVSQVSGDRIYEIMKGVRGFVYCISSMDAAGQTETSYKEMIPYLKKVKELSKIPVFMEYVIQKPDDILPLRDLVDGLIVRSHFVEFLEKQGYCPEAAKQYCRNLKEKLQIHYSGRN